MGKLKRVVIERQERERLAPKTRRAAEVLAAKIKAHKDAIEGVERQRDLMGDSWADRSIAWRVAELRKLGVDV